MKCRHCQSELTLEFLDLGNAPPSNAYLEKEGLKKPELTYPLRILTCTTCWLVQTEDYADADTLFNKDYAYFSSTSKSWLGHAKNYCEMITKRLGLSMAFHLFLSCLHSILPDASNSSLVINASMKSTV